MTASYRRILVAFDGSEASGQAVSHAADLATDLNARLLLLTVDTSGRPNASGLPTPIRTEYLEEAQREIVRLMPLTISITTVLARGEPAWTISQFARREEVDLLFLGSRGHGRLHRLVARSISSQILRAVQVPVVRVPAVAQQVALPAAPLVSTRSQRSS
jgi:nucleotide-binding universal stress UspA family protein